MDLVVDPIGELANLAKLLRRMPSEAQALLTIVNSGMVSPERPSRLLAIYQAFERYGALGALTAGLYFVFARLAFGNLTVALLTGLLCAVTASEKMTPKNKTTASLTIFMLLQTSKTTTSKWNKYSFK